MTRLRTMLLFSLLLLPYVLFLAYSYTQVDPNLVLSQNAVYWQTQQQLWQIGYHQRELSVRIYIALIAGMFASFIIALRTVRKYGDRSSMLMIGIVGILFFSYNALSHDVFNYMFNAKMVVQYHADPHVHVALEFASDAWVRFMNNTHTAAPYGYGWTFASLLPYILGLGKFSLTFLSFKTFIVAGFALLFIIQTRIAKIMKDPQFSWKRWLFFLNPLVLVETIGNAHNDVWMMALYFVGVLFVLFGAGVKAKKRVFMWVVSLGAFLASMSIKYATLALLPVYGLMLVSHTFPKKIMHMLQQYWADISAICMFLPLCTARSQQFHPWYLVWSLSFMPFIRSFTLRLLLTAFSISSMLRYIPYLSTGNYTVESLALERQITWLGGLVIFLLLLGATRLMKRSSMLE